MDQQTLIALALVAAAVAFLGRRLWRKVRGRTGCGCDHCPAVRQGSKPGGKA